MLDDKYSKTIVVAVALTLVVSAAAAGGAVSAQQNETQQTDDATAPSQNTSYLRVAHTSPDAPAVNVTIEGPMENTTDSDNEIGTETPASEAMNGEMVNRTIASNLSFGNVTEYTNVTAGMYNVTISVAGQPTDVLYEGNITVKPRTVSTVMASGEFSTDAATDLKPVAFHDDAWQPADDQAAVSFVHLSPDADAVDVVVAEGPTEESDDGLGADNETETETEEDDGLGVDNETETETDDGLGADNETETDDGLGADNETETDDGLGADNETETEADDGLGADNETETEEDDGLGVDNETETETEEDDGLGADTETEADDGLGMDNETEDSGPTVLAENVMFRNASEYMNVPAGDYTIEIRESSPDNDGEVLATVNLSLEGGQAYSALMAGYVDTGDGPAGAELTVIPIQDATMTVNLPTSETDGEMGDETETETDDGLGVDNETETEADDGLGEDTETEEDDGLGEDTETEEDDGLGEDTETEADDGLGEDTETEEGDTIGDGTDTATEIGA